MGAVTILDIEHLKGLGRPNHLKHIFLLSTRGSQPCRNVMFTAFIKLKSKVIGTLKLLRNQ